MRIAIITVSDKGSRGERVDESGLTIKKLMAKAGAKIVLTEIVPDEQELIEAHLADICDSGQADLILTTGGTGFSSRDVTPEATKEVMEKEVPGIAEVMRAESLKKTPNAMLSRAISGIRNKTLIINLPGSPKAVKECLEVILPALPHGIAILRDEAGECASK